MLSGYQFLIVSYKVLPPKTSGGKFLCGGSYNGTLVEALAWYLEWEREVEALTQPSLKLTKVKSETVVSSSRNRQSIQPVLLPQVGFTNQTTPRNPQHTFTINTFKSTTQTITLILLLLLSSNLMRNC